MLERLSWGSFLIGFGALWLARDYYEADMWALVLLLAGVILIVQNAARAAWKIGINVGTLGIGLVLLLVGSSMLQEVRLNWFAVILLIVGAWITLDALAKRR
jgi:hypothetical protein